MNLVVVGLLYLVAALFNLYVPDTGVDHKPLKKNPIYLVHEFNHCLRLLWRDKLGQISLAVTTLFWGAGATLQFIVLEWAKAALHMDLSKASMLQGIVAVGVALGAAAAAKMISLRRAVNVIPLGIVMGLFVIGLTLVRDMALAMPMLVIVGILSGLFVVPMNALLQHRGHVLMGAGHSIAVQNFNENLSILVMTFVYSALISAQLHVYWIITLFGLFVAAAMWLIKGRYEANQREHDDVAMLADLKH